MGELSRSGQFPAEAKPSHGSGGNYKASISIIEDMRSSIDAEELKATYFASNKRMDPIMI